MSQTYLDFSHDLTSNGLRVCKCLRYVVDWTMTRSAKAPNENRETCAKGNLIVSSRLNNLAEPGRTLCLSVSRTTPQWCAEPAHPRSTGSSPPDSPLEDCLS